jgi:16S rRNA (cytidine1402-2'-O)-methyltransferase
LNTKGKLYLIPTTLGESDPNNVMPIHTKRVIDLIDHYIVENEKDARRLIKSIHPEKVQANLHLYSLNSLLNLGSFSIGYFF